MPRSTPITRKVFGANTSIAISERVKLLSKNTGITMARLFDEAFMDLLCKYAEKGGISMMSENDQNPRKLKYAIAIANHKGGVGKTTTTAALAYLFAKKSDFRVLLMDADAQINLTQTMETSADGKRDIRMAVLAKIANQPVSVGNFILPTQYKNIDMIPGSMLIESDSFVSQIHQAKVEEDINPWEEILNEVRDMNQYDVILVDTHPSIGTDTLLPMQACDYVLIPMEASEKSVAGLFQVYQNIVKSRRKANPNIKLLGYFFNKVKLNTGSAKEYIPSAREMIPEGIKRANTGESDGICFETMVRDSEDARKSDNMHCAVTERFHNKKISADFEKLYNEIMEALA